MGVNIRNTGFLELLENIYNSKGIKGIKDFIIDEFHIGDYISMDYGNHFRSVYILKGFSIHELDQDGIIYKEGTTENIPVFRSVNLPYIENPFQIDFYGLKT